ncbi:MAG: PDZ domain-containing protein [Planctomycetales bacterium]|nr:PDZ domain-containing protein [Planctomycetales bacterium]
MIDKPRLQLALALLLSIGCCFGVRVATAQDAEAPPAGDSPADEAREAFQGALERLWIPQTRLTDGPQVRAAFRDVVADAGRGVVEVRCKEKIVALGGIVGPDGWVVTKATQLEGPAKVRLKDGREFEAHTVGVDREYDLAMLKIDAKDLPALTLPDSVDLRDGDWVATVGTGRDPIAVGVVSVSPRRIPHLPGFLGVQFEEATKGALVVNVLPDTGASRAGLRINDVIVSVNGDATPSRVEAIAAVRKYSPGDRIELGVQRGAHEITIRALLAGYNVRQSRSDYQNNLGSNLSKRRFSFPSAFQHDTVLSADECGGPVVNLDGQVIGFNLARSGRTESYAAPVAVLRTLMFDLMSGKLAPEEG